ncbi:MAG: alpha/beta fold hydrolase, partial [Pseudomonadota bacterium]
IAMDHLGVGTSDKPIDLDYYTFDDHADRLERFMDALDLHDFNFFVQDWGSVIGLYVAAGDLDRYRRIIVGNGGLPVVTQRSEPPEDLEASNAAFHQTLLSIPDLQPPFFDADGNPILVGGDPGEGPEPFGQWVAYAKTSEDFQPSIMCEALTYYPLTEAEEYAYDAPYPHRISMAGARMFPSLRDELVGLTQERKDTLRTYDRPFLTIFGANDPGLSGEGDDQQWMIENIAGAEGQPHERIPDGSHFFQDDKGFEVAAMVDDFIRRTP